MNQALDRAIKKYNKARDKAVLSFDVNTFKEFCREWSLPIPPTDEVIEITMRKMACHITSIPQEVRDESKKWLLDRGYDDKL